MGVGQETKDDVGGMDEPLCPRCCQFTKQSLCLPWWLEVGPHRLGCTPTGSLFLDLALPHSLPAPLSPVPCSLDFEAAIHCCKKEHSSFHLILSVQFSRSSRREEGVETNVMGLVS